jgi:hypothetical protein
VNPNITKGARSRRLIEYLFGPGRSDEHTNPHVVAGYEEPNVLEPLRRPDGSAIVDQLVARLEAPLMAAGTLGVDKTVWHCSLSVRADERHIPEAEWRQLAEKFVDRMGFTPDDDRAGCRWVAVHHGLSKEGNDHVHVVVTMATEAGQKVYPYGDYARAQRICGDLEREHELQQLSPARAEATSRRGLTQGEVGQARRSALPSTDRESVRRLVRASLAGSNSETEWVGRMKAAGLLVKARTAKDDSSRVVGYSVAAKPKAGKPIWYAGRTVDGDLSLVQVRRRWPGAVPADLTGWQSAKAAEAAPMDGEERIRVWGTAAEAMGAIGEGLGRTPPPADEVHSVARSAADTLAQLAIVAEPDGWGPVSYSADALARAGAPPRGQAPLPRGDLAERLSRIAGVLALAGSARNAQEFAALLAVIVQATRLAQRIAELRQAQQAAAAAGQARTAAERMMPLLQQAADAGIRVPAANTSAQVSNKKPVATSPGLQPTTTAPRRRADPGAGRTERDNER